MGAVIITTKKYIPRVYQKQYIARKSDTSEDLYQELLGNGNQAIADEVTDNIDSEPQWQTTTITPNSVTSHIAPT